MLPVPRGFRLRDEDDSITDDLTRWGSSGFPTLASLSSELDSGNAGLLCHLPLLPWGIES